MHPHPARALAGARADLEHVLPRDVAEDTGLVLGEPLGTPHEAGVAEEAPVGRLVLVGVPVPVGAVGPPRLGLVDRAALDPDALRQVVLHGATLLACRPPRLWQRTGVDFSELTPLAGGWSGQTFLAEVGGTRSVVRIYRPGERDDAGPEIDAAVLRLVRGIVPVPDVLEVRRGLAAADRPGLLVTSYLPGERGDLLLPTLDGDGLTVLGTRLGSLAADLAGMPTRAGGRVRRRRPPDPPVRGGRRPARVRRRPRLRAGLGRAPARAARHAWPRGPRHCSTPWDGPAWCTRT